MFSLMSRTSVLQFALIGASMTGCSNIDDPTEATATDESPILASVATELSNADARASGVVFLSSSAGSCSGTLLSDSWVITAAHCFQPTMDANNDGELDSSFATTAVVQLGNNSDSTKQTRQSIRVLRHPSGHWGETADEMFDVALVQLATPFNISGVVFGHFHNGRLPLFDWSSLSLVGATVRMMGYGLNDGVWGTGSGTLRSTTGTVTVNDPRSTRVVLPGVTIFGDSGGPSFVEVYGDALGYGQPAPLLGRYLFGVHSMSECVPGTSNCPPTSKSKDAHSDFFANWVKTTVGGYAETVSLSCNGTACALSPAPVPDNTDWAGSYSPRGGRQDYCYYTRAQYSTELNYDFVSIGKQLNRTGTGSIGTHACGVLPVTFHSDYSVNSAGLSLTASNFSTQPAAGTCPASSGAWRGCRGTGCSVCSELVAEYPNYFVKHPSCGVHSSCGGVFATCSSACPAPTAADR